MTLDFIPIRYGQSDVCRPSAARMYVLIYTPNPYPICYTQEPTISSTQEANSGFRFL